MSRLLVVTRIYAPEPAAASFRLQSVVKTAVQEGWEVEVVTTRFHGLRTQKQGSLTVSRWPVLRDSTGYVRGYVPYLSFDAPAFFRLLFTKKPDIVLVEPPPTTGCVARAACAIRRIPYVWYAADVWSSATEATGAPKLIVSVVEAMEKFTVRGAKAVLTVTPEAEEEIKALGAKNTILNPNGIDTDVYKPDFSAPSTPRKARFVYAGTASEWQGAQIFARALIDDPELAQQAQILYIGGGSAWDELEQLAQQFRTKYGHEGIKLRPAEDAEVVARLLASATAALVSMDPGQPYNNTYPTKALAALSSGVPVIYAGKGPAGADIERNRLGWAVKFEVAAVTSAMREAADGVGDTSSRSFKERAHQWVCENRSLRQTGRRAVAALASLLEQKKSSH